MAAEHASSIRCESLSIQYAGGPLAVADVSLTVPAGQLWSLIGPSGCGKTTLLRLMAGLELPSSGSVTMEPPVASRQGGIAFVFQRPTLLPWRSTLENVMLPLELIGRSRRDQRRAAATAMLESVGLGDSLGRFPHQLSGGMQMRVSIARALVTRPQVLLLDEPFAALDDMLRNQLGQLVLELWRQQHLTVVMVTHNVAESILLSHQIVVMRDGRVGQPLDNPLPWPRGESLRTTAEFGRFYGRVSEALRGGQ
jgi:ABC-type nitrate/sulfonate/bicarbonate transport system ATPase subunit